jgi:hypothetical protein
LVSADSRDGEDKFVKEAPEFFYGGYDCHEVVMQFVLAFGAAGKFAELFSGRFEAVEEELPGWRGRFPYIE